MPEGSEPNTRAGAGDLVALLYDDLRAIAATYCRRTGSGTLQPTVIVHEAFVKLAAHGQGRADGTARTDHGAPWKDRQHFLAIAATAMRQVVIDHARQRRAAKRGGAPPGESADVEKIDCADAGSGMMDIIELDDALAALETVDPRAARIVELRFFAGMTVEEAAEVMGLGKTSVEASWRAARAWLLTQLHPDSDGEAGHASAC